MKLVTIGIPFFNNESSLSYSIKSTISQTYNNLEILLIDDGSTDKSLSIAKGYAEKDPRIKIISDGYNRGLISRLNQIIDMAEGDYIARMDADDMMAPERIEKEVTILETCPEVDVVTTGMASIDKTFSPVGKRCCSVTEPDVLKVFKSGEDLLHASMLVRTKWARANKYKQDFDRAEDRELFTRTLNNSRYRIIPEPLYYYYDVQNMTVDKYLMSYQSERKTLLANWSGKISFLNFLLLLLRSFLKSFAIKYYFLLGREELLFRSKNLTLEESEKTVIEKNIRKYLS